MRHHEENPDGEELCSAEIELNSVTASDHIGEYSIEIGSEDFPRCVTESSRQSNSILKVRQVTRGAHDIECQQPNNGGRESYLENILLTTEEDIGGTVDIMENLSIIGFEKKQAPAGGGDDDDLLGTASTTSGRTRAASHKRNLSKASVKVLDSTKSEPRKRKSPPSSLSPSRNHQEVTKCIRWFGHGKTWTLVAVGLGWTGCILSCFSRLSLAFAVLKHPISMGNYEAFDKVGLARLELCYNETASDQSGCQIIPLHSDDVDDTMFEVARLFGSSSMVFGAFFAFFLTSAVFWETIDLRPVGFGLLITYFLQSFTMLFFDSNICDMYKCSVGPGCYLCIAASFCWVTSCVATAKMESFKQRETRRRLRRARRRAKKALRKAEKAVEFKRKQSTVTSKTTSTSSSSNFSEEPDLTITRAEAKR